MGTAHADEPNTSTNARHNTHTHTHTHMDYIDTHTHITRLLADWECIRKDVLKWNADERAARVAGSIPRPKPRALTWSLKVWRKQVRAACGFSQTSRPSDSLLVAVLKDKLARIA